MKKRLFLAAASGAALLLSCLSASAVEVSYAATSNMSPDDLWARVGNFCGIGWWHPAVASCELSADGKERTLTLKGGGTIVEDLVNWNEAGHKYTYVIKSSPLPVAHYISTIRVLKDGNGSEFFWYGKFLAHGAPKAKAKAIIEGVYKAGADAIVQ
ncbi:MAG TPA: SRPBCC family protein [Methylovirgula sp.]